MEKISFMLFNPRKVKIKRFILLLSFVLFFTLVSVVAFAQPAIITQPSNFTSVCPPNSPTTYDNNTTILRVDQGVCGNNGTFTFQWQYNNGSGWVDVTPNVPLGFTAYLPTSVSTGSGSGLYGTSYLSITLNSSAAPGTYQFRCVVNYSKCSSSPKNSNPITFIINPKPTPTFSSEAGANGCINTNYTYTTQSGQSGYLWNIPGTLNTDYQIVSGGVGSTSNTVTLKWLTSGNKTVSINYSNASGCSATTPTSSTTTTINAQPAPSFTAQPSGNICASTDVTYTTQAGFSNYAWTIPGTAGTDYTITSGGTSSSNSVTLKWLTTGSKTVSVNYTNGSGCSATTATSSNAITVASRPVASFAPVVPASVCAGSDITYTTQAGQSGYSWSISGTLNTDYQIVSGSTSSNSITLNWVTSGNKTVTVNYNNSSGCSSLTPATTTTTANPRPVPSFSAGSGTTTCASTDITYTTQAGMSSYVWTVPGSAGTDYTITSGGIGTTSNTVTLKWLTPGNKTVTVNYTGSGCSGALAATNTTNVIPRPSPSFISAPGAITCANTSVTYTTEAGQTNYNWVIPGTLNTDYTIVAGSTGINSNTVTLQWLTAGSKNVTINYNNASGCNAVNGVAAVTTVSVTPTPVISSSSTSFCQGSSQVLTSSVATSYQWYYNGVIIPSANGRNYGASSGGSYSVKVTNSSGCEATSASFNLTENPLPDIDVASQASSLCFSAGAQNSFLAYTNTYNAPSTYSITWNSGATSAGFTDVTDVSLPVSPIAIPVPAGVAGNTTYSGTLKVKTAAGCASSSKSIQLKITAPPNVNNFSVAAADACVGGGSVVTINSTTIANGTYTVTYNLTGANNSTGNTATMTFNNVTGSFTTTNLASGATTVTITDIAVVGCNTPVSVNNTASLTVNDLPAVNAIGGPSAVCINQTITLTDATSGGTWSTSNPFILTVDAAGVVTGVNSGTATITYTTAANASSCTNNVTKDVTVNALPAIASINGATALCLNSSSILTDATSGGIWLSSDPSVAAIDNSGFVTAVATGTSTITYSINADANGCSNSTSILMKIDQPPTASAGAPVDICESSSPVAIALSDAGIGGGATTAAWSILSGGGSLSSTAATANPSAVSYTPAANYNGVVTLQLKTTGISSCGSASDTKTITIAEKPVVTPGNAIAVCESATPATISLAGASIGGGASTAAWSITSGGGTLSTTAYTANPGTVTYTPPANFSGNIQLTLTSNISGICGAISANRTITVNQLPTVTAGAANAVCQSASPGAISLAGSNFGGGATAAAWSIVSGGGTLSSTAATANPAAITYLPAANYTGTVTLALTSNIPTGCTAVSDQRIIDVKPASTAIGGGGVTVCQSASPTGITLSGASVSGGASTGAWSISSGGGSLSTTSQTASPQSVIYTPAANYNGTATLTLTSDATAPCTAVTATKIITVSAPPTAVAGSNLTTCENGGAVNITGGASATNYNSTSWESIGTGTFTNVTSLTTATYTPSLADIAAGNVTITLRASGGSCSDATSSKNLSITKAPTANAGTNLTTCSNAGAVNITSGSSASNYGSVFWTSDGDGTWTNPNSLTLATYTPGAADKAAGSVTIVLNAIGNGPCANASSSKTLTVTALPVASFSYAGSPYCSTAPNALPTFSGGGVAGTFSSSAGLVFVSASTGEVNIAASTPGTYTVTNTIAAANGCGIVTATSSITITQLPVATFSYIGTPYCKSGAPNPSPTFSGGGVAGVFSSTAGLVFISNSTGQVNLSGSTANTYLVTNSIAASGGCPAVSANSSIVIRPDATIALTSAASSTSQTPCINTAITNITYTIGGAGTGATVTGLPAGVTGNYSAGVFTISGTPTVSGAFSYTVTTTGSACINPFLSGTINISPNSVGGTISANQIICQGATPANLTLAGNTGSILGWQRASDPNFTSPVAINNTANMLSGAAIGALNTTTYFRAIIQSGICGISYSSFVTIAVNSPFTPTFSPFNATICLGSSVTLTASGYQAQDTILGGDFGQANPPGWSGDNANNSNGADNSDFGEATGGKVYGNTVYSSGAPSGGKFMIVDGTTSGPGVTSFLTTPSFSTVGRTSLSLQFYQGYNFNGAAKGDVQISIDGGATFTTLKTYNSSSPVITTSPFNSKEIIDLNAYLGQPNVKVRFFYTGTAKSNWALDDVGVVGPYQPVSYSWSGPGISTSGQTVTVTPTSTGANTYTIITTTGGCTATTATVVVNVNPVPTLTSITTAAVCSGANATITLNGLLPNTAAKINYTINGGSTLSVNLTSNASGIATFTVPVTSANNGQPVTITSITNTVTGCSKTFNSSVPLQVNPLPTAAISGTQTICTENPITAATLTVNFTGTSPWSLTYTDGSTPVTVTGITQNPYSFNVSPTATKTYTITSLTDAKTCSATSANLTGAAVVTVPNGTAGLWTGSQNTNWFDCRNWADGKVPTFSTNVLIPATTNAPVISASAPYASSHGSIGKANNITVNNNTLSFAATGDKLLAKGGVTITNDGTINMNNGGIVELQGSWSDQVNTPGKGFIPGNGTVIFSGGNTQSITATKGTETFYNLTINKTNSKGQVNLNNSVTVTHDLTLTKGIFTTGNNLFTWTNSGGNLNLPVTYTDSWIATTDASGNTIVPNGNNGFRINNVGNEDEIFFPVGADLVSPNRMSLQNFGTPDYFTVVVTKGDIGGTALPVVQRIWNVSEGTPGGTKANMKLYFTKQDPAASQDEVPSGFNYGDVHLVQKDAGNPNWLNVATGADVKSFTNASDGPEIYGQYTINTSPDVNNIKDGITQFTRFSIANIEQFILPVNIVDFKAQEITGDVKTEWTSLNEKDIISYEIERSGDGILFNSIGSVAPGYQLPSAHYAYVDAMPLRGNNFYRIKATDKDGKVYRTSIVYINITVNDRDVVSIKVYPNPVTGKRFNLYVKNLPAGKYYLVVTALDGKKVLIKEVVHSGGNASSVIVLPGTLSTGAYVVNVYNANKIYSTKIVVE